MDIRNGTEGAKVTSQHAEQSSEAPEIANPRALAGTVAEDALAEQIQRRDVAEGADAARGAMGGFLLGAAAWSIIALGLYLLLR